jgi:4-hydroxy-tetrahydrodipicolinate reductase
MKIGVLGCAGRMGRILAAQVLINNGAELIGGTEAPGSKYIGCDISQLAGYDAADCVVGDDAYALFEVADTIIDFTVPSATAGHAKMAAETGTAIIVGTTGLTATQQDFIDQASKQVVVVQAANYSVGVNILLGLTEQAAGILGEDYDIEIVEMHHRKKVDAPSGTALALGQAAAVGRGVDLENVSQRVRDGHTGPRKTGDIGFATLRGGDIAGDHTIIFAGDGERVELTHRASNRTVFAAGAVRAALWTSTKLPGLYSMSDVLALKA